MLGESLVIIIATLLMLALAIAVIIALAVTRRTPEDWENRIRSMVRSGPRKSAEAEASPAIAPVQTSFSKFSAEESVPGNAYVSASEVPGHDRIDRLGERFQKESGGSEADDQD